VRSRSAHGLCLGCPRYTFSSSCADGEGHYIFKHAEGSHGLRSQFQSSPSRIGPSFSEPVQVNCLRRGPYLLELTRHIHLNPLRAGIVKDMNELDVYQWTGHAVIMGKERRPWQNRDAILALFDKVERQTRKRYRRFVEDGLAMGKRADLTGVLSAQ